MDEREVRQRLTDIKASALSLQHLYEKIQRSIRQAAVAGATWEQIGDALGMSGEVARERFEAAGPQRIFSNWVLSLGRKP